jgi:hypothetical protein
MAMSMIEAGTLLILLAHGRRRRNGRRAARRLDNLQRGSAPRPIRIRPA